MGVGHRAGDASKMDRGGTGFGFTMILKGANATGWRVLVVLCF